MGGSVFDNTRPFTKEEFPQLLEDVQKALPFSVTVLGSAGKVDISNDLDLAVCLPNLDVDFILNVLFIHFFDSPAPVAMSLLKGTNIIALSFPFKDSHIQVDLMFVDDIKWAKFAYFSPGDSSDYKGCIRTILLMAIVAAYEDPNQQLTLSKYNNDILIQRAGFTFDLNKGIRQIFQVRNERKDGKGYLKNMTTVSRQEFPHDIKYQHPQGFDFFANVIPTELYNDECDFDSAEQIIEILKQLPEEKQQRIIDFAQSRLKGLKNEISIPPYLMKK